MSIIATDNARQFTPCSAGIHPSVCVDVIDLGQVQQEYGGRVKLAHKVAVRFQVAEVNPETGRRFEVQKRYTLSLNEKATLRKDLESWRGKALGKAELAGFDLEQLVGENALLAIVHVPSRKDPTQTWAQVQTVMGLGKGMERLVAIDYVREKDRPTEPAAPPTANMQDTSVVPF